MRRLFQRPPDRPARGIASVAMALVIAVTACTRPASDADRIGDAQRRVESIRGLASEREVPLRFIDRQTAVDDLLSGADYQEGMAEVAMEARIMKRLGLLPADLDAVDLVEQNTAGGVLGYYDPENGTMNVITGGEIGDREILILAHEHMHALQDEHFGVEPAQDDLDFDRRAAFSALVEGEATIVESMFAVRRLSAESIESMSAADLPTEFEISDDQPQLYLREGEFPYLDGASFVLKRFSDGGWDAIDEIWTSPPTSSEQILHPDRYPHDQPLSITLGDVAAALGPGWSASSVMTMGEMRIAVLLADGIPPRYAEEGFESPRLLGDHAAEGWGGDRLVELEGPDGTWAIVWQTAWDSARDADEFERALRGAFDDLPSAWSVDRRDGSSTSQLEHPVLVLITEIEANLDTVRAALG